jgi:hypothetical protein
VHEWHINVDDDWESSLLIDEHRAWAAFVYLRDCNPRDTNQNIFVDNLKGSVK